MENRELTPMQEAFCQAYAADPKRNGKRAAIAAGYGESGAAVEAHRMLINANIFQRIRKIEIENIKEAGYSKDSLIPLIYRKIVSIIATDPADIVQVISKNDARRADALNQIADDNGGQYTLDFEEPLVYVKPTKEWSMEERAAVKAIKRGKEGIEIEFYDVTPQIKLLSEIIGLKENEVNVSGNIELSGGVNLGWSCELPAETAAETAGKTPGEYS